MLLKKADRLIVPIFGCERIIFRVAAVGNPPLQNGVHPRGASFWRVPDARVALVAVRNRRIVRFQSLYNLLCEKGGGPHLIVLG